jgi:hypothetical protein
LSDHSTPNLPARDFEATAKFYAALGFMPTWKDDHWMILTRGTLVLEFFRHPQVEPLTSWFSCCLRLDDLDAFYARCLAAGLAQSMKGYPRLHAPKLEPWGGSVGALIDLDGTLIRLIQN